MLGRLSVVVVMYIDVLPMVELRVAIVVGKIPHPKAGPCGPFPAVLSSIDATMHPDATGRLAWPDCSGELVDILRELNDRGCHRMRVVYPALS